MMLSRSGDLHPMDRCEDKHILGDMLTELVQHDLSDQQADELLVNITCRGMSAKLRRSREMEGKHGWQSDIVCNQDLMALAHQKLQEPTTEAQLLEVINLLAMIRTRILIYGEKA